MITAEQLAALKSKLDKLTADKSLSDEATQTSNDADAAAVQAAADAATAKLAEQTADAAVTADLADLIAFVDSLAPVTPPATPQS